MRRSRICIRAVSFPPISEVLHDRVETLLRVVAVARIDDVSPVPVVRRSQTVRLFKQSLHQLGDVTVPAAWAGIWTVSDTMKLCGIPGPIFPVQTHQDTMCVGDVISGDQTVTYTCNGTATATTVDMTCTGSSDDGNGCVGNYTETLHGTRTGEDALLHYTINVTYTPTGCSDDGCIELVIEMHRTAGPPPRAR